jgi:hypothetical protein
MANLPSSMKIRLTVAISGTASDSALFDAGYGVRTPIEILYVIYRNCYKTAVQRWPVRRAYNLNLKAGMKKQCDFMK